MRVLLDECIDPACSAHFSGGFQVAHVKDLGLLGIKNGELVRKASGTFDVLVTIDRNMQYQTSLKGVDLAVVIFRPTSGVIDFEKLISQLESIADQLAKSSYAILELKSGRE